MFWSKDDADGMFRVVADHMDAARRVKLREVRGDDKTFCSESYGFSLDSAGRGPIATAARTGKTQSVSDASECQTFKRRALAAEFDIQNVFFVPSALGVIEYGTPKSMVGESGSSEEQLSFIKKKMAELERDKAAREGRGDRARRLSVGVSAFSGASFNATKLARNSRGRLHKMLHRMAGAKGAKAPKVQLTRAAAAASACAWLGVFITLLALSGTNQLVLHLSGGQLVVMIASWGALMTLLFSAPASPLVQPRNVFGGNLISASVAIAFYYLSGAEYLDLVPQWLALALAPATAIGAMQFLGVSHPPAGAVSLLFITGPELITGMQWAFLLCPLLLGNVIAVLLASWINNLSSRRQYPMYW